MSPAEQPSTRVTQLRSSVSQLEALRARIRSQSKKVAAYIQASPQAQMFIAVLGSPDSLET
jgi:hypothetical protein